MKLIENFKRDVTFQRYQKMDNPFIFVTVPINITPLVKYCEKHHHFYGTFGYIICKTVNEVPAFRYRYIDNKYYFYDKVDISFTEFVDENVVFFDSKGDTLEEFITNFKTNQQIVREKGISISSEQNDVIWVSCLPWFKMNSLIPPFNKEVTIPQFIWDKYELINGEYHCNLMIMVHHGFADGYQVHEFIEKLEKNINNFNQ